MGMVRMTAPPFCDITGGVERAKRIAAIAEQPVELEFNEIKVVVQAESDVRDIVADYWNKMRECRPEPPSPR